MCAAIVCVHGLCSAMGVLQLVLACNTGALLCICAGGVQLGLYWCWWPEALDGVGCVCSCVLCLIAYTRKDEDSRRGYLAAHTLPGVADMLG